MRDAVIQRARDGGFTFCFVLVLALVGCGDSGIVVAITGAGVDELEFQLGTERDGIFWLDSALSGQRALVSGRNLSTSPYALWLHGPPVADAQTARLRLFAIGWRRSRSEAALERVSVAVLEPPQQFIPGKLLRRTISLQAFGGNVRYSEPNGCAQVQRGEAVLRLAVADNADCDPVAASAVPPDCDDADERRFPGATERCNGIDDDCDGALGPAQSSCYARVDAEDPGTCRRGTRVCEPEPGVGPGPCELGDAVVPDAYCTAYVASCQSSIDPPSCLARTLKVRQLQCTLAVDSSGVVCPAATFVMEPLEQTSSCSWQLRDDGGWVAGFGDAGSEVATCTAPLRVDFPASGTPSGAIVVEQLGDGQGVGLVELTVTPATVETCGASALTCTSGDS